ncbi:MAG TPA: phosphatase PAP2 family protein [Vicinamibacterales bacterium]|jgi:membrane-associated phospholipid phosphatase
MSFNRANVKATVALTIVALLTLVSPVYAQTATPEPATVSDEVPSLVQVFTGTLTNFRNLPTRDNFRLLIAGGLGAAAAYPVDRYTTRTLGGSDALHEPLEPGAIVGGTPFALGAAFATYGIGRATTKPRVARLGAELIQAQLMAETLAFGVKQIARRDRPDGTSNSFPSGHTTVSFASADVLRRTFGWKIGVPAYAVASYVAASRIQSRRHYLSDVVFGAALGTVAGRTVAVSRSQRLAITPVVSSERVGVVFSLHPRATTAAERSARLQPSDRAGDQ